MRTVKVAIAECGPSDPMGYTEDVPDQQVDEFDQLYKPPQNSPVVKKAIEIINHLCTKYKYAVLKDHDPVSDDEIEFNVDYKFNGKEMGVIKIILEKQSSDKWGARIYLSVKRAARLPITNLCMFVSDFKRLIANLHIVCKEMPDTPPPK
jgi:hypothetical protein